MFGYINLTRSILHAMKERREGVIVNVIGYAGERLNARYIIGSTGNAALMAFSRSVGSQAPDFGVRVVAVNPGYTATDRAESMLRKIAESKLGSAERWRDVERELNLPFGRMGTAERGRRRGDVPGLAARVLCQRHGGDRGRRRRASEWVRHAMRRGISFRRCRRA